MPNLNTLPTAKLQEMSGLGTTNRADLIAAIKAAGDGSKAAAAPDAGNGSAPTGTTPAGSAPAEAGAAATPKRRGRPPGSKNTAAKEAKTPKGPRVRKQDPRIPAVGTVLTHTLRSGLKIAVTIEDDHFVYQGERFSSLSTIAKKVTGVPWNGLLFFGLVDSPTPTDEAKARAKVRAKTKRAEQRAVAKAAKDAGAEGAAAPAAAPAVPDTAAPAAAPAVPDTAAPAAAE